MNRLLPLMSIMYWLGLCAWIAAIVTVGIAASIVFTTLPAMNLSLNDYAAYDHAAHGRLAAGMVMQPMFAVADTVQFAACGLVVVGLVAQLALLGVRRRPIAELLRGLCILAAAGTLVWQAIALSPAMNRHLHAYWDAAKVGDAAAAREHQAAFEPMHVTATTLVKARLALLLGALAVSAVIWSPRPPSTPRAGTLPAP